MREEGSVETFAETLDIAGQEIEVGRTVIWRAKDGDYPVTIAGDLGVAPDGRRYVSVESTNAGIPVDELKNP
jgi:hypothetical protein